MSKIYINDLSDNLKEYINNLGLSEEQVQYILDEWVVSKEIDTEGLQVNNSTTIVSAINTLNDNIDNIDLTNYQKIENEALDTENKTIVEAINEIFNSKDIIKQQLIAILVNKGISVTTDMSFSEIMEAVDNDGKIGVQGTAVAANVLSGKTFINSTGKLITGTMVNQGSKTITPGKNEQTLPAGYYSKVTITGDSDLVSSNIKYGKSIFGVSGSARESVTFSVSLNTTDSDSTHSHSLGKTPSRVVATFSNVSCLCGDTWIFLEGSVTLDTSSSERKSLQMFGTNSEGTEIGHSFVFGIDSYNSSSVTFEHYPTSMSGMEDLEASVSITVYR